MYTIFESVITSSLNKESLVLQLRFKPVWFGLVKFCKTEQTSKSLLFKVDAAYSLLSIAL